MNRKFKKFQSKKANTKTDKNRWVLDRERTNFRYYGLFVSVNNTGWKPRGRVWDDFPKFCVEGQLCCNKFQSGFALLIYGCKLFGKFSKKGGPVVSPLPPAPSPPLLHLWLWCKLSLWHSHVWTSRSLITLNAI